MLQLRTKTLDICRVSKLLAKYNIKANIFNQIITLEGEISDELLCELCNNITICNVQNFASEVFPITLPKSNIPKSDKNVSSPINGEDVESETQSDVVLAPQITEKYDLIYDTVKRGEVYICDFGKPYGSEQGKKRLAIIVQNDCGNLYSPTTIVMACTSRHKKMLPVHYSCVFSDENMIDYDAHRAGLKQNVFMAEQIKTVDKTRLRKYIGTMTPEFMDKIQEIIDISLGLKRPQKVNTKMERVHIDKPVHRDVPVNTNILKEYKDLNMVQIQLLSFIDVNDLLKIAQAGDSNEIKVERILRLFGFDMQKDGVQYLFKAILISLKEVYFNLETLCNNVSKSESNVGKDKIKKLIIARVKELFKFKKSPTIDFIRLVNSFMIKKINKMKKIIFKVSAKNERNVVSLIRDVNRISCRIQVDMENGFVIVENDDDDMIDSVIELIDQYYTISIVNISNNFDELIFADDT